MTWWRVIRISQSEQYLYSTLYALSSYESDSSHSGEKRNDTFHTSTLQTTSSTVWVLKMNAAAWLFASTMGFEDDTIAAAADVKCWMEVSSHVAIGRSTIRETKAGKIKTLKFPPIIECGCTFTHRWHSLFLPYPHCGNGRWGWKRRLCSYTHP